jgi:hypothetical protein
MKLIISIFFLLLFLVAFIDPGGLFIIVPQPFELKQTIFVLVTLLSFIILVYLHMQKRGFLGLFLFFFTYPFLSQSVHYINISSSFFVITPPLLFLLIHFLLTKEKSISYSFLLLNLFLLSTLISIFFADNVYTAIAFFVLAVPTVIITTYLIYARIVYSHNPVIFIRNIIFSILAGIAFYIIIELIVFQYRPSDFFYILLRRQELLSGGRYFTGGYREPAGLAYVLTILFFILFFIVRTRVKTETKNILLIEMLSLFLVLVMIIIVGTRSALLLMVYTLACFWILNKTFSRKPIIKLRPIHVISIVATGFVGAYLVLPRTFLTDPTKELPPGVEPTYISFGNRSLQVVGSTSDYIKHNRVSLKDFLTNPIGSGPLNATPLVESELGGFAAGYYFSLYSNLVVVGATYGWLSLFLWIIFHVKIFYDVFRLKRIKKQGIYSQISLCLVLLAILMASLLPGSPLIGPGVNWGNFPRVSPISVATSGLPAEYPSIISGVVLGSLLGLIGNIRSNYRKEEIAEFTKK